MKRLIYTITLLILSLTVYGQNTATSTGDGNWTSSGTWTTGSYSLPPVDAWAGNYIIIEDVVSIPNNVIVDLSTSEVIRVTIKSSGSLVFGSNAKLILPEEASLYLEEDAEVVASNNSQGTLIQIGENGVWGRNCEEDGCTNADLVGPGTLDKNSSPNNPLPIKLLSFKALVQSGAVLLDWVTAWEENFDFFTVERAGADLDFQAIGTVRGNGNTMKEVAYAFTDTRPTQGQAFYRLKATDYDGSFEYHKIISVSYDAYETLSTKVYPNPVVGNTFKIESQGNNIQQIQLLDLSGKMVYAAPMDMEYQEVNLPSLVRPGAYVLMLMGSDGSMQQQKIMIL